MTMPSYPVQFPADYPWQSPEQYREYQAKFLENYTEALRRKQQEDAEKQKLLSEYIESQPAGLYTSAISGLGKPVKSYFSNRYSDIYNKYLASLVGEAKGGETPTGKFSDFLSKYDYMKDYMSQPYAQRGGYEARRLAPGTRYLPY